MKTLTLNDVKQILKESTQISFSLPNGELVPAHFHVTEIGLIDKKFIDCGGTIRHEQRISFQLWNANDYDHRLHPEKLIKIIELSEKELQLPNLPIEVEYQGRTIEKYNLSHNDTGFVLSKTLTDCLAPDKCQTPSIKVKTKMADLNSSAKNTCDPNSGCC